MNRMIGRMSHSRVSGAALLGLAASAALLLTGRVQAQDIYQKPPNEILRVLNAPVTPRASVGRARDIVLLYSPVLYPPIADVAQPFERLAGVRKDVAKKRAAERAPVDNL